VDSKAECIQLNPLTRPLLPYGYSCKVPVPDGVKPSFVIFDIQTL